MNTGEKIRAIRSQKMMTQTELAGTRITRNMLSCIENGTALPSLPTLIYLAGRLGVPAGLLLAEDGDEFAFHKINRMPDIQKAFSAGDWQICRDLCASLDGTDDELNYLICLCDFHSAVDAFCAGDLRPACRLFDQALAESGSTAYPTDQIRPAGGAYISYMRDISPSFDSDADFPDGILPDALGDPFCRYYSALRPFLHPEDPPGLLKPEGYLASDSEADHIYIQHIRAKELMEAKKYQEAYGILHSMLNDNIVLPAPMLYFIFSDMEICCTALSDYRSAYEYSSDKLAMLERFFR